MAVKHIYVVHHSHTDIGYTDLQERVLYTHADYIRTAVNLTKQNPDRNFCWNCEAFYCVKQFLDEASEQEKSDFFEAVKNDKIGISASYLNFNDLADAEILNDKTAEFVELFKEHDFHVRTAMNADINGISPGARDAMIRNGIEFLFTNIHTHHGMYPLYQNQTPFFWENDEGKRMLVFSGDHYNLGNFIGMAWNDDAYCVVENFDKNKDLFHNSLDQLKISLDRLIAEYEQEGYPYDFLVTSVSGVYSDNAPPNFEISTLLEAYNQTYDHVKIEMVTLEGLYQRIRDKTADAPVYRGDMTDWWANGVGSTPYAVKHFKEGVRNYHICRNLGGLDLYPALMHEAEENILLYAEHTWGHSSTISNPYDTMVQNLDIRKISYASKAHEASAKVLNRIQHKMGDTLRYYNRSGRIKAVNPTNRAGIRPVEFFNECGYAVSGNFPDMEIINEKTGEVIRGQIFRHPRGSQFTFIDYFEPMEEKTYTFRAFPLVRSLVNRQRPYMGAEQVRDVINSYDTVSYQLPHRLENDFFRIEYNTREGVTSFYNKVLKTEMLGEGIEKFFTPLYENSALIDTAGRSRRKMGRNIRGVNAKLYQAELTDIKVLNQGCVFNTVELIFRLEGTYHSSVIIRMYNQIPRIDFKYKIAKTLSEEIESIFLPIRLHIPGSESYIDKGGVKMRPGIDQLPGAGMEYFLTDTGVTYVSDKKSIIINLKDAPLIYQSEMYHHDIKLCDNKPENNQRAMYSWIMNNTWETNFKMDLSGFDEFCYTLTMMDETDPEAAVREMESLDLGIACFIIG